MAMLYRHHVEFAVGHGVSVHAEVAEDSPARAASIETVIVPTYEVPRTAPPTEADADENPAFGKLAGLVLDMKCLAEADAKKLPKLLEPLVMAYREWIDREETKLHDPKEGLGTVWGCRPSGDSQLSVDSEAHRRGAGVAGPRTRKPSRHSSS